MQKDMDHLLEVINRMNEVISGIDSISLETNLLALNASIEAARQEKREEALQWWQGRSAVWQKKPRN